MIHKRHIRYFLNMTIVLCLIAGALSTEAEAAPPDPAKAEQWYKLALSAAEDGRWVEAALAFDAAYAADPAAELLYNSARAYEKGGQVERALEKYEQFLVEKEADPKLREKAVKQMLDLKLQQQQRRNDAADSSARDAASRRDAEARARLARELAEAEERRLQLEIRLEQERKAARTATSDDDKGRPSGPSKLELHRAYSNDRAMVVKAAGGVQLRCESNESPCSYEVPPGVVSVSLEGYAGRGQIRIRPGETTFGTGKVVSVEKTSAMQIVGIVLVGGGVLGLLVSYPIAVEVGASGDDYLLGLGISAAIGVTGGLMWLLWPSDKEQRFLVREERQTTSINAPSFTVGISPYRDGAIVGATGTF